mgnify:CR=1 FL=1
MLETEFKFFRENYHILLERYSNKYVVIKGKKVIGTYDTHSDAFTESIRTHVLGTFLIKYISEKSGMKFARRRRFSILEYFRLPGLRN